MIDSIIDWILSTSLNDWVLSTYWAWPLLETLHFFGLSILMGSLLIIDLRMMGFFKGLSFQATHKLLPLVFFGFALNLITGILFLFGDPIRYAFHTGFQTKMVLVFLAGINALWFYLKINGPMHGWGSHEDAPMSAKIVGFLSLVFWFAILVYGRLIPYISTG